MARRRNEQTSPEFQLADAVESSEPFNLTPPGAAAAEAPQVRQRAARGTGNVISVRITDDGQIDTEHMSEKVLTRLKTVVARSGLVETSDERKAGFAVLVPAVYGVLGTLEGLIAAYSLKIPRQQVAPLFVYSAEEVQALTEPTAGVLAKHGGVWTATHLEEVTLALMLLSIHQTKLAQLQEMREALASMQHQDAQAQPVAVEAEPEAIN